MSWRTFSSGCGWLVLCGLVLTPVLRAADGDDLAALQEKAMKAASAKVSPSIVQIETSGGNEFVGSGPVGRAVRKGIGPTTGLVVAADGFIISSAFNFANKPSAITVTLPGHKEVRHVAKVIATDHTRMVTLIKIEVNGLPVPAATPKKDIRVGQWALALGRSWTNPDDVPSMSAGIISATGRIWGKAIQTDAKVSPVNYGGPLVDIRGRVQGVLVPASPRSEGETAGLEWYDSGIGFAIPLEDVNAVLPRLKQGQDLRRGLLGVVFRTADIYGAAPVIASVAPESAAAKADIRPGDTIVEVDNQTVVRIAQIHHILGNKYEGDVVNVKVKRGNDVIAKQGLKLSGILTSVQHPFLGVLPVRDDPELGEEIRYVFPKSPADAAGLKAGDRIMKVGIGAQPLRQFSGRDQLTAFLHTLTAGTEIKLEVVRAQGKKTETVTVKLGAIPDTVPEAVQANATAKKALEPRKGGPAQPPKKVDPKKKPETGFLKRSNAGRDHQYWIYVPDNYDANISYGIVLWLHPVGKGKDNDLKEMKENWEFDCDDHHYILVAPKAENDSGWLASESDVLQQILREVGAQYTIDPQRIVVHGMGVGGEMAVYLAFHARDLVRGVCVTGAAYSRQPSANVANQPLSFFVVAGDKDPRVKAIQDTKTKLIEQKYPVVYREITNRGHEYLSEKTFDEVVRWLDTLDRQ